MVEFHARSNWQKLSVRRLHLTFYSFGKVFRCTWGSKLMRLSLTAAPGIAYSEPGFFICASATSSQHDLRDVLVSTASRGSGHLCLLRSVVDSLKTTWGGGSVIKCLSVKHEDQSLDLRTRVNVWCGVVPVIPA